MNMALSICYILFSFLCFSCKGMLNDCDAFISTASSSFLSRTVRSGNTCLTLDPTAHNGSTSKQQCASDAFNRGRLAVVKTAKVYELIRDIQKSYHNPNIYNTHYTYIGFVKTPGGIWEWLDGTPAINTTNVPIIIRDADWFSCGFVWKDYSNTDRFYANSFDGLLLNDMCYRPGDAICEIPTYQPSILESLLPLVKSASSTDELRHQCYLKKGAFLGSTCYFSIASSTTWTDCFNKAAEVGAKPARFYTQDILERLQKLQGWTSDSKYHTAMAWDPTDLKYKWMNSATKESDPSGELAIRPLLKGVSTLLPTKESSLHGTTEYISYEMGGNLWCYVMITSKVYQKFTVHTRGARLAPTKAGSTLFEKIVASPGDERVCALECQQIEGCLSFNSKRVDGKCQGLAIKSDAISHSMAAFDTTDTDWEYYEREY